MIRPKTCRMSYLFLALGVITGTSAWAQAPVVPGQMDRSFRGSGARALGMGGTYVMNTEDTTAAFNNPAALASMRKWSSAPLNLVGRARNFNVARVQNLYDDIKTIVDQVDSPQTAAQQIALINSSFNRLQGFISSNGTPMVVSLTPATSMGFRNFALGVSSQLSANLNLVNNSAAAGAPLLPNVVARGGLLATSSVALGYGQKLKDARHSVGVALKMVRADYVGVGSSATTNPAAADPITGTLFNRVNATKPDLDLAWSYLAQEMKGALPEVRAAAVMRNVLGAKFSLPQTTSSAGGIPAGTMPFSFRLNQELDLAGAASWSRVLAALEVHNATRSNGGKMTLHVGGEWSPLQKWLRLRAGLDDSQPTFGVGFGLGPVALDVALGTSIQRRLGIGLRASF